MCICIYAHPPQACARRARGPHRVRGGGTEGAQGWSERKDKRCAENEDCVLLREGYICTPVDSKLEQIGSTQRTWISFELQKTTDKHLGSHGVLSSLTFSFDGCYIIHVGQSAVRSIFQGVGGGTWRQMSTDIRVGGQGRWSGGADVSDCISSTNKHAPSATHTHPPTFANVEYIHHRTCNWRTLSNCFIVDQHKQHLIQYTNMHSFTCTHKTRSFHSTCIQENHSHRPADLPRCEEGGG